jgi:hypothetical protein
MALTSEEWSQYKDVILLYIDSAKYFANLSMAALAATVIFRDKVIGGTPGQPIPYTMIASWAFYLLTIAVGGFYQYFAIKLLDSLSYVPGLPGPFGGLQPGFVYGVMACAFVVGSILLVITSWSQLKKLTR